MDPIYLGILGLCAAAVMAFLVYEMSPEQQYKRLCHKRLHQLTRRRRGFGPK